MRRFTPRLLPLSILALVTVLAMAGPADAQDRGNRGSRGAGDGVDLQAGVVFDAAEREVIVEFFRGQPSTGMEALPPGIRRRLARGKPLPPGIAKQVLPAGLEQRLPVRDGYQRVQVGVDVLLVEVATGIIHDVLMDVVR